jgi:hypothetical protein
MGHNTRDVSLFGIGQFGAGLLLFTAGARMIPVADFVAPGPSPVPSNQ